MSEISQDLLRLAREVMGRDYKEESGLTDEQWRDLEKGLKGWFRKARSNLMGQKGPVVTSVKMAFPKYDGKWPEAFSLADMPDPDKLSDSKVEIQTKPVKTFGKGNDDTSRLRKIKLDIPKALKAYTDVDVKSLNDWNFSRMYFIIREWWYEIARNSKSTVNGIIKTEWGDFQAELRAGIGGLEKDKKYRVYYLSKGSPYVEGFAVGVGDVLKKNKAVVEEAKRQFADGIRKRTRKLLEQASDNMKDKLLQKHLPRTYNALYNQTRNPVAIYEFVQSGKGGKREMGYHREVVNEDRHWAEVVDYPITLLVKPSKSMDFEDLFDDSRFKVVVGRGIPSSFEV
jgi:hypothetical protein